MKSDYSIKTLLPLLGICLVIGISSGLTIGYMTPDHMDHMVTAIFTACVSVMSTLVVLFFLFLRPTFKQMGTIAHCLTNNLKVPTEEEEKILRNTLITGLYKAITDYVGDFYARAKRLGSSGNTIAIGSAEVSSFVDNLNGTIQNQAQKSIQIASAAEEISQSTSHVADSLLEAVSAASSTHASCVEGETAINKAIKTIHGVNQQVKETSDSINNLKTKSEQIQSITEVINSVAEQTNLLALNAAIEAARAGEHGRGFAVVADEVRELANKTASATSDIAKMLGEIRGETVTAVGTMEELVLNVDDVVDKTELIGTTLQNINEQASSSESQAREIQEMIQEHVLATSEISNSIEHVRAELQQTEKDAVIASEQAMKLAAISETISNDLSIFNLGTIHDKHKALALKMAQEVTELFENSIENNLIPENYLFDREYKPISGTDPQKYHTKYDDFCDSYLPAIQEKYVSEHPKLAYSICTDPGGYVPTHNNVFAKPAVGDFQTDLLHSRSKRLYTDPTGIRCGSHTQEFLMQTYKRDTGEIFHDLSVPIYVNGQHWGGVRLGYKAEGE
jgi:methyl-accepting chemotaxis protein